MAQIEGKPKIELMVTIALTESEARAVDAMAGYGDDAFVKAFYDHLGQHYMKPHEQGLRTFLKSVRQCLPSVLGRADAARNAFTGRLD
jgi:hypothetical protein